MALQFEGKVALVTGAASGMGKASAIALAREGASLLLGDVNEDGLERSATEIREQGGRCETQPYDAMDEASCVALVAAAQQHFGKLDILANIAGISNFYNIEELTREVFDRFITVNLSSVMTICREAIPLLKETRGCIINFASINAKLPIPYHTAYCASKAGVLAITKCMALELLDDGVRANVVCPGAFDTPMNDGIRIPEGANMRTVINRTSVKETGQPEQAADLVVFLASEASHFINGADLTIDGGAHSAT